MGFLGDVFGGWFGGPQQQTTPQIDMSGTNQWAGMQGQQGQDVAKQNQAYGDVQSMAQGKGPSLARELLKQGAGQSMANQNAMASSAAPGQAPGMARRQAMMANAGTMNALGQNAATAGAQEQMGAIGMEGQEAGQMRGQDIQSGALYGNLAGQQAGLQQQTNELNAKIAQEQAAQAQQNFGGTLNAIGSVAQLAAADLNLGQPRVAHDTHMVEPGGQSHWILREEPNFILAKNARTGEMRKILTSPLTPEEHHQATRPHGADGLPGSMQTHADMGMGGGAGGGGGGFGNVLSNIGKGFEQKQDDDGGGGGGSGGGSSGMLSQLQKMAGSGGANSLNAANAADSGAMSAASVADLPLGGHQHYMDANLSLDPSRAAMGAPRMQGEGPQDIPQSILDSAQGSGTNSEADWAKAKQVAEAGQTAPTYGDPRAARRAELAARYPRTYGIMTQQTAGAREEAERPGFMSRLGGAFKDIGKGFMPEHDEGRGGQGRGAGQSELEDRYAQMDAYDRQKRDERDQADQAKRDQEYEGYVKALRAAGDPRANFAEGEGADHFAPAEAHDLHLGGEGGMTDVNRRRPAARQMAKEGLGLPWALGPQLHGSPSLGNAMGPSNAHWAPQQQVYADLSLGAQGTKPAAPAPKRASVASADATPPVHEEHTKAANASQPHLTQKGADVADEVQHPTGQPVRRTSEPKPSAVAAFHDMPIGGEGGAKDVARRRPPARELGKEAYGISKGHGGGEDLPSMGNAAPPSNAWYQRTPTVYADAPLGGWPPPPSPRPAGGSLMTGLYRAQRMLRSPAENAEEDARTLKEAEGVPGMISGVLREHGIGQREGYDYPADLDAYPAPPPRAPVDIDAYQPTSRELAEQAIPRHARPLSYEPPGEYHPALSAFLPVGSRDRPANLDEYPTEAGHFPRGPYPRHGSALTRSLTYEMSPEQRARARRAYNEESALRRGMEHGTRGTYSFTEPKDAQAVRDLIEQYRKEREGSRVEHDMSLGTTRLSSFFGKGPMGKRSMESDRGVIGASERKLEAAAKPKKAKTKVG